MSKVLIDFIKEDKDYKYINLLNTHYANLSKANPSILFHNNVLFVNFRSINYLTYISDKQKYFKNINGWMSANNAFSENYLAYIVNNKLTNAYKNINLEIDKTCKYAGLEDAILTSWNNQIYLCGTRCDFEPNRARFCIYKLDNKYQVIERTIINDESVVGVIEKHWSPIEDKPFTFIRWCNPTEIVTIEPVTGKILNREIKQLSYNCLQGLRGNCQTVKYKDGYLSIVHDTKRYFSLNGNQKPVYKHYFIKYNYNFEIEKISKPFNFEEDDIEFCCGLQNYNNIISISYSVRDSIPVLIQFNESCLENLFDIDFSENSDYDFNKLYEKANDFLNNQYYCAAASCYSKIFTNTNDKELEYNSLLNFCICLLIIKNMGTNLFSDDIIISFIDTLLLLKENVPEPYYLLSIYYGMIGDLNKKEIYRKLSSKYRFNYPEIKRYLKMW